MSPSNEVRHLWPVEVSNAVLAVLCLSRHHWKHSGSHRGLGTQIRIYLWFSRHWKNMWTIGLKYNGCGGGGTTASKFNQWLKRMCFCDEKLHLLSKDVWLHSPLNNLKAQADCSLKCMFVQCTHLHFVLCWITVWTVIQDTIVDTHESDIHT